MWLQSARHVLTLDLCVNLLGNFLVHAVYVYLFPINASNLFLLRFELQEWLSLLVVCIP